MLAKLKVVFSSFFQTDPHERVKLVLLSISFFFIVGTYSVFHSLKPAVFASIVGLEYQPYTQWCSIALIAPTMLLFSFLVSRLKQHQLLFFISSGYALTGFFFAYMLSHPIIGLANTHAGVGRILGWTFYIYVDFYQILIISTFWAFSNSITTPDAAKKNYGFMVAFSKIAGAVAALSAGWFLKSGAANNLGADKQIPVVIFWGSVSLLVAAVMSLQITRRVPMRYLHGYEAAYQVDQKQASKQKVGFLEGLKLFVTQPYVLGIFGLVFSYEIINAILDYQMHLLMWEESSRQIAGMSASMLNYTATFQIVGFLLALVGTTSLLRYLDVKFCVVLMPIVVVAMILWFLTHPSLSTIFVVMVAMRAMHYSFDVPVREILYIPAIKSIRFKSKAWIDSFGRTFSKTSGSVFNIAAKSLFGSPIVAGSIFSLSIAAVWGAVAVAMARKYTRTIANNEVIGYDGEASADELVQISAHQ